MALVQLSESFRGIVVKNHKRAYTPCALDSDLLRRSMGRLKRPSLILVHVVLTGSEGVQLVQHWLAGLHRDIQQSVIDLRCTYNRGTTAVSCATNTYTHNANCQ